MHAYEILFSPTGGTKVAAGGQKQISQTLWQILYRLQHYSGYGEMVSI
ncbi:MAG: hypothetical protein ACLSH1_01430 [Clostridia bacterium]